MVLLHRVTNAFQRLGQAWPCRAVWIGLAGLWCCAVAQADRPPAAVSQPDAGRERVVFDVELADPVSPSTPPRVHRVVQFRDQNGFPVGYALRIATPICFENERKVLDVTMHWNAVGCYERLEWPREKPLTKKNLVPFTAEDYAKLDSILKDQDSILATHSLAFLAKPVKDAQGIDGLSGATPLTVQESVIQDAAYETWVMWRWANGKIVPKLCHLTEQSCTPAYLKQLLYSQDRRYVDFALNYAIAHHPADAQFLEDVFCVLERGDREHVVLSLRFLKGFMKDKEPLHARLIESYGRMKSMSSPLILDFLAAERDLPRTTLEGLTGHLDRLPYFQVNQILRLLEQRNFFTKKTESDVVRLLDGNDFFVARRACEHLQKQNLGSETQEKINAFRQRYRDRL